MHDIAERSGRHIAEFSCTSQFEGSISGETGKGEHAHE